MRIVGELGDVLGGDALGAAQPDSTMAVTKTVADLNEALGLDAGAECM